MALNIFFIDLDISAVQAVSKFCTEAIKIMISMLKWAVIKLFF